MSKTIQLNNQKYQCPTSWDDVTLADQIRIADIAAKHTGLTSQLQLIAGYANIPVDEIKHTHISKLPTLVKHLEFVSEELDKEPISEFEHKGHKYYLMPTLLNGEFQDFISLEAVMANNSDNPYEGLPMMIAIIAKRENESLDDYDLEERSKEFLDLPIVIANKVSGFFLNFAQISLLSTPTFLNQYQEKINQEVTRGFEELENTIRQSGGQGLLGRFQRWTLRKYVKSLKKNWSSSLIGTQSKS